MFHGCNCVYIPCNHSSGCLLFLPTSWRESIKLGSCQIESSIPGKLAYLLPEFPETIPRTSESLKQLLIMAHNLLLLCYSTTTNQFQVKQGQKWKHTHTHTHTHAHARTHARTHTHTHTHYIHKYYICTAAQRFWISKICCVLRESLLLIKAIFIQSKIQKKL